jgi:hypothetical protein
MKHERPMRWNLSRRAFLLTTLASFAADSAVALDKRDEDNIWGLIVGGDLGAARAELAQYLSENKLDHEATFLHARLAYALDDFQTAHRDFTRVVRYAGQLGRQRGIVAEIGVIDVDVWLFLCERRMGQEPMLAPGIAGSVRALMLGDISPEAFVEENIRQQRMLAERLHPVTSSVPTEDGQEIVVTYTVAVPTEELRPVLRQNAAFALGQAALARADAKAAESWLRAVVKMGPPAGVPHWLEYYVAKQQLQSIAP